MSFRPERSGVEKSPANWLLVAGYWLLGAGRWANFFFIFHFSFFISRNLPQNLPKILF